MEIRLLTPDDAPQWLRLRIEALEGDPEAFSASLDEYRSLDPDEVKRRLWSDGDAFVLGAFERGCLCGMAGFYREKGPKSRHKGRVWGVYVTPGARGARIGYKMMQALLDRAMRIEGMEQVLLSVTATQEPAIRLYRSIGFKSFGREPRALRIGDRYMDEEYMILPVSRSGIGPSAGKGKAPSDLSVQDPRRSSSGTGRPRLDGGDVIPLAMRIAES